MVGNLPSESVPAEYPNLSQYLNSLSPYSFSASSPRAVCASLLRPEFPLAKILALRAAALFAASDCSLMVAWLWLQVIIALCLLYELAVMATVEAVIRFGSGNDV